MIRCHNCGTDNLDGSEYCDECGVRLRSAALDKPPVAAAKPAPNFKTPALDDPALSTPPYDETFEDEPPPPEPPVFTTTTGVPKAATPAASSSAGSSGADYVSHEVEAPRPGKPAASAPASRRPGDATAGLPPRPDSQTRSLTNSPTQAGAKAHAKLVISRGANLGKEFPVMGPEAQIGRWDADNGIFPDIDLDQFDPEAKVSRRHARIITDRGQYLVEDLGSTNGTFINRGRRLIPGSRQPLRSGDELIIGKTFLKFIVEN